MKCLFNVKNLKTDKNGKFIIELSKNERLWIEKTKEEMKNTEIIPELRVEFKNILPAIALMHYAYSLARNFLKTGCQKDMENAIAVISRAYLIHPLPIYLYDLGRFFEYNGNYDAAKQSYIDYLKAEKDYKPGHFDEMLVKDHNIPFIINDAIERIKILERGENEE